MIIMKLQWHYMKSSRKIAASLAPALLLFTIIFYAGCDKDNAWETADSQANREIMTYVLLDMLKTFTVGGTVTLGGITSVTLQNNLKDDIIIAADGNFHFPTQLHKNATYSVTATPSSGSCTITNGTGTIVNSDITDITVNCTP